MSAEHYKAVVNRAVAAFDSGVLENYVAFYHPQAKLHFLPPGMPQGREGARLFYSGFLAAFPDAKVTVSDVMVDGDMVAERFMLEATHRGAFMGVPPTGRRVAVNGITMFRIADDQIVERWSEANFLGLLQQIGALPA